MRALALAAVLAFVAGCTGIATRPIPPKVDVEGVRVVVDAAGMTRLRVLLEVRNDNAYPIAVQSIEAAIRLEDQAVATAALPQAVSLAASGPTHVEVEARPDFAALRIAVERMLRSLAGHYEVTGFAVVQDGIRLDFHKQGDLPLAALLGRLR